MVPAATVVVSDLIDEGVVADRRGVRQTVDDIGSGGLTTGHGRIFAAAEFDDACGTHAMWNIVLY
jgi:hypothetical protein